MGSEYARYDVQPKINRPDIRANAIRDFKPTPRVLYSKDVKTLVLILLIMEISKILAFIYLAIVISFILWFFLKFFRKNNINENTRTNYPWLGNNYVQKNYPINTVPDVKIVHGSYPNIPSNHKPKYCHFCNANLNLLNNYFCSVCSNYFCVEHRNHGNHQGVYSLKDPSIKLSFIDNCLVCREELTTLSKVTCLSCFKSFCVEHIQPEKHSCKPLRSGPFHMAGYEYPDGTRVYYPGRKTGALYQYTKKSILKRKNTK